MGKGEELYMDAVRACLRAYLIHSNRQEAFKDLILSLRALIVFERIRRMQ